MMNYRKITVLLKEYDNALAKIDELRKQYETEQISIYGYQAFTKMAINNKDSILNGLKHEGIIITHEGGIYDKHNTIL